MGLGSEMKNLTEELLASFKNRIKENEELVNDVQKTLDGFRKDQQEMADIIKANAAELRKGLANGEMDRLNSYNDLMNSIHISIGSIQQEVIDIQKSTVNMITEFSSDRAQMSDDLNIFFTQERTDRLNNEKTRLEDFDALMAKINQDIQSINKEVATIFMDTNNMIARFEKEHTEMSVELRAELSKNLAERIEYTRTLLNGFQKRLAEISKENQTMANNLRKDLANGESERLSNYDEILKGIHISIKEIQKEVMGIQKYTATMLDDLLQNRVQAEAEWNKMLDAMNQIRVSGVVATPAPEPPKVEKKTEKKEVKKEVPVEAVKDIPVEAPPKANPTPAVALTLEEKILNYINEHPKGVKISEMEEPLGETRMKLGFIAKALLDAGKVQKIENFYFPLK